MGLIIWTLLLLFKKKYLVALKIYKEGPVSKGPNFFKPKNGLKYNFTGKTTLKVLKVEVLCTNIDIPIFLVDIANFGDLLGLN
jgi:hypothetical protein